MKHFCDGIHGKSVAVEKDGECFLCEGSASIGMIFSLLVVAVFALIALFFVDMSIFNEVWVLTSWATHNRLLVACVWICPKDSVSVFARQKKKKKMRIIFS